MHYKNEFIKFHSKKIYKPKSYVSQILGGTKISEFMDKIIDVMH